MNVLTIGNRPLTKHECVRVSMFIDRCVYDFSQDRDPSIDLERLESQDAFIQEWFDLWCGEASVEHNLHADDDRDLLWEKFCEEVAR